ncbi:MAG: DUF3426 domain-containing protein [Gammaproteobacteria bacterium]|nr:MAG: DUF3426 domain-containing protein [Gammaproteobacteria bacterium]
MEGEAAFGTTHAPPEKSRRPLTGMWLALSLLAALAIAAQYLFFYADVLGKNPDYRPWVMRYCDLMGCSVPPLRDTSKISSDKLLVYSKPENPGALNVDAVIINKAGFAQPFPELLLRFENLQGEVIAQRRFTPQEYLDGEMTNARMMPPGQPVRLALTLVDPGQMAVSYSLFIQE